MKAICFDNLEEKTPNGKPVTSGFLSPGPVLVSF